jgi:hypothetical protein
MIMHTHLVRTLVAAILLALGTGAAATAGDETLRFKVYLGQDPIGEHNFALTGDTEKRVRSQARFDVDFLVFTAYRYRHESRELWRDGCLERIDSSTDDNGTDFEVQGIRSGGTLALEINGDENEITDCVGTFAYWDRRFLDRPQLLNPQTGELVSARLTPEGSDQRSFRGQEIEAERYRLRADDLDITLWYTPSGEWIGLESDTGRGRILRYERV